MPVIELTPPFAEPRDDEEKGSLGEPIPDKLTWENAPEDLLVTEAAELLRCHPITVYRRLERGEWPFAWKVGQSWRIDKVKLRDHMKGSSIRQPADDPMPKKTRREKFRELLEAESMGRVT